jgi:hypothetical protein
MGDQTMSQSIHLQGIGRCSAIRASELRVGTILSWNYAPSGYQVVSIAPKGQKSLTIVERNRDTGEESARVVRRDRLVAAHWPQETLTTDHICWTKQPRKAGERSHE